MHDNCIMKIKSGLQYKSLQVALFKQFKTGANNRNRTDDLFITSELLYRLSYIGPHCSINISQIS